jgi:universal stress protein E
MRQFKNILVGVDLSQSDRFVSNELPPPSVEAIERALWLANRNSACLTYFYALDVSAATERIILESDGGKNTVLVEAQDVLKELAARATGEGVTANIELRFGKSWLELIRQVLRNKHDLVVAGTRHQSEWQGYLMGSTSIKLLRKCPCPVWITQPQLEQTIKSILVAHDLRSVGDLAMELGCSMAELHGAQLHVLHSLEFPELDVALPARISAEKSAEFRAKAERHIYAQLANYELAKPPQVHIITETPDFAILERINRYAVELLVMGTIARTGIAGFVVGNTAERLLPRIPCSVLAVKPDDFICPVGHQ